MSEAVTTPKSEFLRLKSLEEDVRDLHSPAEILGRIEAGTEELIPRQWSTGS